MTNYRPTEFEVDNAEGIAVDIRVDPESLRDSLFFEVAQASGSISVTLECLNGLVAAANELLEGRKDSARKREVSDRLAQDQIERASSDAQAC